MVLILLLLSPLAAEDRAPIGVEVISRASSVRLDAPIPLVIGLTNRTSVLRSGRLMVELHAGAERLTTWTSNEWVLGPSAPRRAEVVLPPVHLDWQNQTVEARLRWREEPSGAETDLGDWPVSLANQAQLSVHLGILVGNGESDQARSWAGRLRLEDLITVSLPPNRQSQVPVRTVVGRWAAEQMPESPLTLYALDVLCCSRSALEALRPAQHQAVVAWVRAGGALVVVATGADQEFTLAPDLGGIGLRDSSRVQLGDPRATAGAATWASAVVDLGRVILVAENAASWAGASACAWGLRRDIQQAVVANGAWLLPVADANDSSWLFHESNGSNARLYELGRLLRPAGVQVVPLWLMVGLMIGFLILVGPVDRLVLGRLKLRRWTWLTFPVAALATTGLAMLLSEIWLGQVHPPQILEIVDLGADGSVIRRERLAFWFSGSTVEQVAERHQVLWSDISVAMGDGSQQTIPAYAGSLPGIYTSTTMLGKWIPALTRESSVGGSSPLALPPTPDADAAFALAGPRALVLSWRGGRPRPENEDDSQPDPRLPWVKFRGALMNLEPEAVRGSEAALPQLTKEETLGFNGWGGWFELMPVAWIRSLSVGNSGVVRALRPPMGGASLDDLACFDPQNPESALLVVARPTAEGVQLIRRCYRVPALPVEPATAVEANPSAADQSSSAAP